MDYGLSSGHEIMFITTISLFLGSNPVSPWTVEWDLRPRPAGTQVWDYFMLIMIMGYV